MAGDLIYTPIWKAGHQRRFALAGLIAFLGEPEIGETRLPNVSQCLGTFDSSRRAN